VHLFSTRLLIAFYKKTKLVIMILLGCPNKIKTQERKKCVILLDIVRCYMKI